MSTLGNSSNARSSSSDSLLSYSSSHDNASILSYATQSETYQSIRGILDNVDHKQAAEASPSPWLRKPLWVALDSSTSTSALDRHLSLFDLICIGVGATVGSGIFVLCGLIAREYAGPATFISWGIAGLCACASGLCYAELSGKFSVAGSSYSYVYVSMGELPAVIAGACLTLEYVFSASAVARSWGDKVVEFIKISHFDSKGDEILLHLIEPGYGINPMAFLVSTCSVLILLVGVKESKRVTNFFTTFKVGLVLLMSFGALSLMKKENLQPLIPPKYGITGVLRGATSSFFGYIGFDEICCMSGEAKNPSKNMPRAVLGTIVIVTILYIFAAIALVGMVPYNEISVASGFPDGFETRGLQWASEISALGELITLPIVVLVTIMAQPRLQFAMACDGLLPPIFAEIDNIGNLWYGTLFSGISMIAIATFVPFTYLNDLISAGILVAFTMTDMSVILLRRESPSHNPLLLEKLLGWFNFLSFALGISLRHYSMSLPGQIFSLILFLSLLSLVFFISTKTKCHMSISGAESFQTPFVPYLPLFAIFLNWYLIGQLEVWGLFLLAAYICISVLFYFMYSFKHSVGNRYGWDKAHDNNRFQQPLQNMISLPRVRSEDVGSNNRIRESYDSFKGS